MLRMTIYILLLLSVYAVAYKTTICNCKDPIRREHLRIDDELCQPIRRLTERNADYADIILQEENDLIDTPLGRANISDGVHTHNHMTLIWDVADAGRIAHTTRLLTQGKATITQTSTTTPFKLEDDSNQLAYTHD
ncbi:hypothetical protein DAPPUDRAFT_261653 [Daphnia pulex]|uniref:Uncharacterized protein n=1 Tax=Daphnia pulex TaxID=6669 RepID=E9HLD8_DAPPU|nr:hypothetical protein DAPPUDRAFT_261653 [Daphnia pulex]|eukprot:EFX67416.1 hypothetical protein DAPPUDRAFT_261653 [Daphnia pulex]